ncbi:hypothetical protein Vadar_014035 [Vaccinium darrowii]|uniref:Uncharacterized protein n=1 Tax=Vaccinium darrowii TaxID=229202 RepID=A0ACB7X9L6_9ERIC|nr:hypothetical protein Vadar_014035 [Vaccinium darrowii]
MELDPSLIEISGEDDSLLQQIPTLDNYYFSCSPLQIPGSSRNPDRARVSPTMGLKDNVNVEQSICSSPVGSTSSNKENVNANKSEVPNLSMEPQQMKRKKRGGAYNLRKSLAWDRAFFTEEGVLDPLELSLLSGSFGNSSREVLPTINEEGRKVSSNSGSTSESADMQATAALKLRSSTDPRPTLVMQAKCGLDAYPAAVLPPSGSRAPDTHDVSKKSGIPTAKPSGLRKPSPSLGFFCQPKSSASNISSGKDTQPSNIPEYCTPSLQRIKTSNAHDPRLLRARGKIPKIDYNSTVGVNASVLDSSKECSVPCAGSDVSGEKGNLKLEGNDERMKYLLMNQEVHNSIDDAKGFQECGEAHKDNGLCKELGIQMNDNNMLLQRGSSGPANDAKMNDLENINIASQRSIAVLEKGDPGISDSIKNQHMEEKPYSFGVGTHAVMFECHSESTASDMKQDFVVPQNDNLSDIHDVDECSWKNVELKKASSGKVDQILHGENHNLLSNEGILLEGRNLFDSQRYQSENVEKVDLSTRETNRSEKLSSESPPRGSAVNESTAAVDPSNGKLQVEDVQVHLLDTTLLAKVYDKLSSSEIHDQYMEFDDDSQRSGEPLKPRSGCLLVEQASELNHGFPSHDYSLLSEGTPAEECHGVYGLQVALKDVPEKGDDCGRILNRCNVLITQNLGATQAGGVDVHEMLEQPQVKATLSISAGMVPKDENRECDGATLSISAGMVPKDENRECDGDTQFEPDLSSMKSRDHLVVDVTNSDSIVCSLSKEEDKGANGLKNNILEEKSETEISSENRHEDNGRTNMNAVILFMESRSLDEFHHADLGNSTDVSLINQNSSGGLERCRSASLEYTEQANEDAAGMDKSSEDTELQSLDGNPFLGSSYSSHSNSAMDSQSVMAVADVDGQSSELPKVEQEMPSLVGHNSFQYHHGLRLNDYLLHGKSSSSDESQEEKVIANVLIVGEQNDGDSSESKSFSVEIQEPLSTQDSDVDTVGMAEHQLVEHGPSSYVDNETSTVAVKHSVDTILWNEMVHSGQATSSESDLAVIMGDDDKSHQAVGVIATDKASCLTEEPAFTDDKIQSLANETDVVNPGVEKINAVLLDDIGVEISQTNVSPTPTGTEDKDRMVTIKNSGDGGKQNNLVIKPPINAVPFSDEWLAAMEAAGEDILTKKSGAVQNSPPDRSLREPGPWSPVKRKHNEIGPYDCTKFNIPPPDSD